MAIRGPFIIPMASRLVWKIRAHYWDYRLKFPGLWMCHNWPRKPKRRIGKAK